MNDGMIVGSVFVTFFIVVYNIIRITQEHKVRLMLVEKGLVDENVKHLFNIPKLKSEFSSLKWGMVSLAVGIALVIGRLMADRYYGDETTAGLMFLFGGLALVIYYFIERKQE